MTTSWLPFPNAQRRRAAPALDIPAPVPPSACPVEHWLGFLGHRWNALILWHLSRPLRHNELASLLPSIAPKVLSERLLGLTQRGLIAREVGASFPRTVTYNLTPQGQSLLAILDQLELWSKRTQTP